MLRTLEKYFGAISTILFAFLMIMGLYVDPKATQDFLYQIQKLPRSIQGGILVMSVVTAWSGIKEFTG